MTHVTRTLIYGLLAAVLLASPAAQAAQPPIRVAGDVEKPGEWTAERITQDLAAKVEVVRYTMKGEQHTARCVPLLAFVEAAAPRLDPQRKNQLAGFVVVVRARDGYTASFSLVELTPEAGEKKVWLALDVDGKPLPENEGPVRLLIPGEGMGHHRRWIFGIATIRILDGAKLAPLP